jgi:wyosine [tRNA(Phe)-imidazoG37] synthetase (radical SAM superfamily)
MLTYGPVPSRRFGRSLGVDIVPFKTCTYDCVYCQLGRTTSKTVQREHFISVRDIIQEVDQVLKTGCKPDFITIAGSGEPTLNADLGAIITSIKQLTDIKVVVLTNGSLLWSLDVQKDCLKADIIAPSLDAGSDTVFNLVNRPHQDIQLPGVIQGLIDFRSVYRGEIWLEVFLLEGMNDHPDEIERIKDHIQLIRPSKVQLNTAVRPTEYSKSRRLSPTKLSVVAALMGDNTEVIPEKPDLVNTMDIRSDEERVLGLLRLRPCTVEDVTVGLSLHRNAAIKYISDLEKSGKIQCEEHNGSTFYLTVPRAVMRT